MSHIAQETLDRLFAEDRDADVTMCVHGVQTRVLPGDADDPEDTIITRVVGHPVVEDWDGELTEDVCLVLDIPMDAGTLALTAGHFADTMDRLTDKALGELFDGKDQGS